MTETSAVIHPKFHHVNLKTTRLQEMIDWYGTLVGAELLFQDADGAWLTNDEANHRIALLAFPGFVDDPDKDTRTGMHHSAFEYDGFEDLNASYLRLREAGIEPDDLHRPRHDVLLLLQGPGRQLRRAAVRHLRRLGEVERWMRTSDGFPREPDRALRRRREGVGRRRPPGESFAEIHARAMADELAPAQAPVEIPTED